jgi:hypothetical protein
MRAYGQSKRKSHNYTLNFREFFKYARIKKCGNVFRILINKILFPIPNIIIFYKYPILEIFVN